MTTTERIFSLSCFEGLRLFRIHQARYPNMPQLELLSLIYKVEADARSLDMEAAACLSILVEADCPLNGHAFYQTCIKAVLLKRQPIWRKFISRGRRQFVRKLSPDNQAVFAAAGLMEDPPPPHVVIWWDGISGFARLIADQEKMEQARAAELLTLEHERKELKKLGITEEPEWPGFDDNFAGYDVLSYRRGQKGYVNKLLIEVKSTTVSPLRFIVTRHEWETAKRAGDAYIFHLWDMRSAKPILHIRTADQVELHIPTDNNKGNWKNAEIRAGQP